MIGASCHDAFSFRFDYLHQVKDKVISSMVALASAKTLWSQEVISCSSHFLQLHVCMFIICHGYVNITYGKGNIICLLGLRDTVNTALLGTPRWRELDCSHVRIKYLILVNV